MFHGLLQTTSALFALLSGGQDIRFDYQMAVPNTVGTVNSGLNVKPVSDPVAPARPIRAFTLNLSDGTYRMLVTEEPVAGQQTTTAPASSQTAPSKISISLSNATVSEVINELTSKGIEIVAAFDEKSDQRISMTVENQPLETLMAAVARALRGSWSREGTIWVFEPRDGALAQRQSEQLVFAGVNGAALGGPPGVFFPNPPFPNMSATNAEAKYKKFLASITPAQAKLHTKQGRLKVSDLSLTQRGYLSIPRSAEGWVKLKLSATGKPLYMTDMTFSSREP